MNKTLSILTICDALVALRSTFLYNGRWIREDILVQLVERHSDVCQLQSLDIHQLRGIVNRARHSHFFIDVLQSPNNLGVFRKNEKTLVTEGRKRKSKRVYYYFFTKHLSGIPPANTLNSNIITRLPRRVSCSSIHRRHSPRRTLFVPGTHPSPPCSSPPLLRRSSRIHPNPKQTNGNVFAPSLCSPELNDSTRSTTYENTTTIPNTKQATPTDIQDHPSSTPSTIPTTVTIRLGDSVETITNKSDELLSDKLSDKIKDQSKWHSPEALSLFVRGTNTTVHQKRKKRKDKQIEYNTNKIDVKKHVVNQIQILRKAYLTLNGWRCIIDDCDTDDVCTAFDIFTIRLKAKYLAVTLSLALSLYETTKNFLDICQTAINKIDLLEYNDCAPSPNDENKLAQISSPRTIMDWLRVFRTSNCFPNPSVIRKGHWKNKLPPIFYHNPDLYNSFVNFAKSNLQSLSGELLHDYLFNIAIPKIVNDVKKTGQNDYTVQQFLKDNELTTLNPRTVYNWLKQMGFTYSVHKKSYYVDSHEKPENVAYRREFLRRYEQYELRTHRWVQIPLQRFEQMVQDGELSPGSGYRYNKNDEDGGCTYIELHVDDHPSFQDECNNLPYGGHLSVRKDPTQKPLMIMGQDECIFKQYTLATKSWSTPDGTRALLPKDDGQGVMVSSFVCRELGYNPPLNKMDLARVNIEREKGERVNYFDQEAAKSKYGVTSKPKLTCSPFTRLLEYGANNEGYWNYESMVIQLEDCVDVLQVLYPQFDFLFLFDHSNGHDRMQPNGLNSQKINKYFGGKQVKMRDSKLTNEKCFGPYHDQTFPLQLNSIQSMVYKEGDEGPFHLTTEQRIQKKFDKKTKKTRKKYYVRDKLIEMLKEMNILTPVGSIQHLRTQCRALNLPVDYTEEIIEEGWLDKPKGSLQILYERGFIDPNNIGQYTDKGRVGEMGMLEENTSLKMLLQKQPDFSSELTLLQFYAEKMGVKADRTPKCHPEIAGEGIEYLWALAKLYYRCQPLSRKRSKKKFRELVDECLSVANLTLVRSRMCSRRAREYMIAYKVFDAIYHEDQCTIEGAESESKWGDVNLNHELIEKSMKMYKTHRNVRDIDVGFIKKLKLEKGKVEFLKEVVSKMKTSF
jgi:hypothetical protein